METGFASSLQMLSEMTESYRLKTPSDYDIRVNIKVLPANGASGEPFCWYVSCESGVVSAGEGQLSDAQTTFTMAYETLHNMYTGLWSGLTAAGRAHIRDRAPLEFSLPPGVHPLQAMQKGYFFLTHFFNKENPTCIRFGPSHTRNIHGAGAAALFYYPGLRSAYYAITSSDKMNADLAKDPFSQAFIVISGKGRAKIADRTMDVSKGMALYIPPGSIHILETDGPEPLEIIWIAWGPGA